MIDLSDTDVMDLEIGTRISTEDGNATITGRDEFECYVATFDATDDAGPYGQEVIIEPEMLEQITVISQPLQIEAYRYYNDEGQLIGQAVRIPGGQVMVFGHDYDAQPLADGFLEIQLGFSDDFASAEHKIRTGQPQNDRQDAAEAHCGSCGLDLDYEPGAGWVTVLSGDLGGTYDFCPMTAEGRGHDVIKH